MADVKEGVVFWPGMHPAIEAIVPKLDRIFIRLAGRAAIITSARDSRHSEMSFHYEGRALDLRSNDLPTQTKHQALQEMKAAVRAPEGYRFDILLEAEGEPNEHYHLELDDA